MIKMSQKLLLPFKLQILECGWKVAQYKSYWGYPHYGIDITSTDGYVNPQNLDHTIYSSGKGIVLKAGKDSTLGYAACILYKDCLCRDGVVRSATARYMHMKKLYVTTGQEITVDDKIGVEGAEGTKVAHLHIEFDSDTRTAYAHWSPQVSSYNHTFWNKGTDSTLNPSLFFYASKDRVQTPYPFTNRTWINEQTDVNLPIINNTTSSTPVIQTPDYTQQIKDLQSQIENLKQQLSTLQSQYNTYKQTATEKFNNIKSYIEKMVSIVNQ